MEEHLQIMRTHEAAMKVAPEQGFFSYKRVLLSLSFRFYLAIVCLEAPPFEDYELFHVGQLSLRLSRCCRIIKIFFVFCKCTIYFLRDVRSRYLLAR